MTDQSRTPSPLRGLNDYDQYVIDTFAREDEVLQWIQAEADRHEMPKISLRSDEARTLQLLIKAIGARKVLEIGTLAGYSGTWIARALPADGKLITLEKSSKHAGVARASFEKAGVSGKVTLIEGAALDSLKKVESEAPFDLIFMDADRSSYPTYLQWVSEGNHLRVGGILAIHNAFASGRIITPESADDKAMSAIEQTLAKSDQFEASIIGVGDGTLVAVKVR